MVTQGAGGGRPETEHPSLCFKFYSDLDVPVLCSTQQRLVYLTPLLQL